MPRATQQDGSLRPLSFGPIGGSCYFITPCGNICLKILPDISDSKGAAYSTETATGRSTPLITYAYSDARTISTELHFMVTTIQDIKDNLRYLRIIQSLVYPGGPTPITGAPFTPPPVVRFICGSLMDGSAGLCLILKNYSVRYPPDVAWDWITFLPYRFSVSCNWEVVYACKKLPTNRCILNMPLTESDQLDLNNVSPGIPGYNKALNGI